LLHLPGPLFGHNLAESQPRPVIVDVEPQAPLQDVQHPPAGLDARKLVSQTRMPPQLTSDLKAITLAVRP
jgi:hypothetical protein